MGDGGGGDGSGGGGGGGKGGGDGGGGNGGGGTGGGGDGGGEEGGIIQKNLLIISFPAISFILSIVTGPFTTIEYVKSQNVVCEFTSIFAFIIKLVELTRLSLMLQSPSSNTTCSTTWSDKSSLNDVKDIVICFIFSKTDNLQVM